MEEFEELIKSLLVEIMTSQEAETLQDALTIVKTIKKIFTLRP